MATDTQTQEMPKTAAAKLAKEQAEITQLYAIIQNGSEEEANQAAKRLLELLNTP